MSKKAIVIGSGIAGIASAIRLAACGYEVTIFEKNNFAGGKLSVFEKGGYRFDGGPSLFTMPQFVDELFELTGKNPRDYFNYQKSNTACHYFFEDGTFLKFHADEKQLLSEVETKLGVDSKPLKERLAQSKFIYDNTHETFLEMSLHRLKNFFSFSILKTLLAIPKLELFTSMHRANKQNLNHPKLVQIFDRFATYNGSNPYKAPGILNVIPHLEHGFGTYFPVNGMHSIPQSLLKLANELGVKLVLNKPIHEIVMNRKKISGVRSNNEVYDADVVFCNSD
ncbi:MAG: FAD-dependent oxidoreductase, partial [Bacteroidetes bacterium]|nr:FAD-dependent oxidoreductase [Bacteroidota bacterium]